METQNTSDEHGKERKIRNITNERRRELWRFLRDISASILAFLTAVWTIYAAWDTFQAWGIVIILALALILAVWFYYHRKIRSTPYLKEGDEAELEAIKLLRSTKESLHYYGGVGLIGLSKEWQKEYINKLKSEVTIIRFLDIMSLNEMRILLKKAMPIDDPEPLVNKYHEWILTHCKNLVTRSQHNCFYDFKGAPIWRYGLHCIIFDRKHIVLPFASRAKTTRALFIPNCPEIANALTHCLEWLVTDFSLKSKDAITLARRTRIPWPPAEEE